MILRLEDGPTQSRTIYNSKTGMAYIIEPNTSLSGKKERKARKAARKAVKAARREAKTKRKIAKIQGKTERKEQRQAAKTQRQATRQQKRQTRQEVGVERQNKRMIRVKGRQEIIQRRQQSKMDKFAPATMEPVFEPEQVDALPNEVYESTPGGDYMVDTDMFYPDSEYVETIDTEYEEYPEEEQFEDGLSFGFIPGLVKGAANLITKATQSKAGQAVTKVAADAKELQKLRMENLRLIGQTETLKTHRWVFAAAGTAAGLTIGYLVGKKS